MSDETTTIDKQTRTYTAFPQSRTRVISVTNAAPDLPNKLGLPRNDRRRRLMIEVVTDARIEYGDDQVTFGAGMGVTRGVPLDQGTDVWTGDVYICAGVAGPVDVRIREEWIEELVTESEVTAPAADA